MQVSNNKSRQLLRPAHFGFIALSFVVALFLNMLPTRQWLFMPDWAMLILCFWSVRESQSIKMGGAFLLGLFMDAADNAILGQHALAYVLVSYAAASLSRRLLWFPLPQQALQVLPLFCLAAALQIFTRLIAGGDFPGWGQFLSPVVAALLWPLVSLILLLPQYQPEERDENRPL